jgi:hypothetical protein
MPTIKTPNALQLAAGDSLDIYSQRVARYFRSERDHLQAIVRMMAQALAETTGPGASVTRLREIARGVEGTSELEELAALRGELESCLSVLRQNRAGQTTPPTEPAAMERAPAGDAYVAAFRLQRAELVASRFGRAVLREMLDVVHTNVKLVLGPADRVQRWKDMAIVAFTYSGSGLYTVRGQFSKVVSTIRLQHINVGNRSAMLSIGLDWTVLPHLGPPNVTPEEVEAFLSGETQSVSWSGA